MRASRNTCGLRTWAFAAVLLSAAVSACDSAWGIEYCTAILGGDCSGQSGCCVVRGGPQLRRGLKGISNQEALPSSATGESPLSRRELQGCQDRNVLCDDPHMTGLSGQSLEWSGEDGGWYALIHDEDMQINVRLTAPLMKDFPNRQLVTGVSVLSGDGHSFVVEVKNPYSVETSGCPSGVRPCLADGALRIAVDGKEPVDLLGPVKYAQQHDGLVLSTSNLPLECWQFGGGNLWLAKYDEMLSRSRGLSRETFEEWVMRFAEQNMAAPDWCAAFISDQGLDDVQSTHAVLNIVTPFISVRVNAGINHQGGGEQDWDGRVLPDLDFWQMNMGLEGLAIGDSLSGILGETSRPVIGDDGNPIMTGDQAIRGKVEDYRVSGACGTDFQLLHNKQDA